MQTRAPQIQIQNIRKGAHESEYLINTTGNYRASLVAQSVKNPPVMQKTACSVGDLGSIPGLGRSPGEGNGNTLQYFSWSIPWTEEPGGLQFMGFQESDMT